MLPSNESSRLSISVCIMRRSPNTECEAHGDLTLAFERPGEKRVRNLGTRDEQHDRRRARDAAHLLQIAGSKRSCHVGAGLLDSAVLFALLAAAACTARPPGSLGSHRLCAQAAMSVESFMGVPGGSGGVWCVARRCRAVWERVNVRRARLVWGVTGVGVLLIPRASTSRGPRLGIWPRHEVTRVGPES